MDSIKSSAGARGRLVPARRIKRTTAKEQEAVSNKNALEAAKKKLGSEQVVELQNRQSQLDTSNGGNDQETGNGMIICLLQQNLSHRQIRAVLGCGKGRIRRICKELRNSKRKNKQKKTPSDAATVEHKEKINRHLRTYDTEDGYSCSHRRMRKYFVVQGLTQKKIYEKYASLQRNQVPPKRVLSYDRWNQYRNFYFPGLKLARSREDLCDACVRIDTLLLEPNLPLEEKELLEAEKIAHLDEAIKQRRHWSKTVRQYLKRADPNNALPEHVIPDYLDDEVKAQVFYFGNYFAKA